MIEKKLRFLEKFLGKAKFHKSQKEAVFICPFCKNSKLKLSVNLETNKWNCWICHKGGQRFEPLIKSKASKDDIREYRQFFHVKTKQVSSIDEEELKSYKIQLPKTYMFLLDYKDSILGKKAFDYLLERGITEDDILFYKIGICVGEDKFRSRIIFPSFDKTGELNFFTARKFDFDDQRRKYEQESVPKGYLRTIILNELNLDFSKPIILVEGFVDMMKTDSNTAPLFTTALSKESKLFKEIVANNAPVRLALDADAVDKSLKIAEDLMSYGIECYFIDVDPYKDVGQMTKKEFKIRYENAKLIDEDFLFSNRIKGIC